LEVYWAQASDAQHGKRDGDHIEEPVEVGEPTLADKNRLGTWEECESLHDNDAETEGSLRQGAVFVKLAVIAKCA
jgi:hypothetical protein